jgi:hypothetical protein
MRMTMMNGIPLTGYTYSEVLELLSRMARPVRIKFADVSKGIVVRIGVWFGVNAEGGDLTLWCFVLT